MKENFRILVLLLGFICMGILIVLICQALGFCLDVVDSVIMCATLCAAITIGIEQLRRKPSIRVSPSYEKKEGDFYCVVANFGNRISDNIKITGDKATEKNIVFLSPNEKQSILVKMCVGELPYGYDDEDIKNKLWTPEVGISENEKTIYICSKKWLRENPPQEKVNWIIKTQNPLQTR